MKMQRFWVGRALLLAVAVLYAGGYVRAQEMCIRDRLEAIGVAVELIDLNHHQGQHPRMGAVDVVPVSYTHLAGYPTLHAEFEKETSESAGVIGKYLRALRPLITNR